MLSHTCKTAIRAVIYLASKTDQGAKSGIKEIADIIDASEHTVGKLLQVLVKHSVINSTKGPAGGFYISASQKRQPIMSVVEAIDGKELFKECGLGLSKCSSRHPCPVHNEYKLVRDMFEKLCHEKTIADLGGPVTAGLTYLVG
jgi:Rrf2 family protein